MKTIDGDLIELGSQGKFDVIVHGCNCQNAMGAGIAKSIKARFPEAYAADCETERGSADKLGTFSSATVSCGDHELTIVNAYIQVQWRGAGAKVNYDSIRSAFRAIKQEHSGKRIAYPMIGAGLAGDDWGTIAEIIAEELGGEDHTLVRFRR